MMRTENSWAALSWAFFSSFRPRYWLATTAPPVARADNIWIKLDHSAVSADKTIAILRNGYETTFSLTLSLEELGIAHNDTLERFRFYLAECADGGNDFNFYGSDVKYKGTAFGDGANCNNYATFTLATEKITLASEN